MLGAVADDTDDCAVDEAMENQDAGGSGGDAGSAAEPQRTYLTCLFCPSSFGSRSHLKRHVQEVHMKQKRGVGLFSCPHCEKSFTQGHSLRKHIAKVHERRVQHICSVCGSEQSDKSNLQTHMRLQHGNRPKLTCEYCPSFETVFTQSLAKHRLTKKHLENMNK